MVGLNSGGLGVGDNADLVQAFVAQTGVTFPVGWDRSSSYTAFPKLGAVSPFPLHVVIDADGRIAYLRREHDLSALEGALTALLGP